MKNPVWNYLNDSFMLMLFIQFYLIFGFFVLMVLRFFVWRTLAAHPDNEFLRRDGDTILRWMRPPVYALTYTVFITVSVQAATLFWMISLRLDEILRGK